MDSFKKVCEFMQGVTPSMIEQKTNSVEIVNTKKDNHPKFERVDDCLPNHYSWIEIAINYENDPVGSFFMKATRS